jgi:hypothetical protein
MGQEVVDAVASLLPRFDRFFAESSCASGGSLVGPVNRLAGDWLNRALCPTGDEALPIIRPAALWDMHHDDRELGE